MRWPRTMPLGLVVGLVVLAAPAVRAQSAPPGFMQAFTIESGDGTTITLTVGQAAGATDAFEANRDVPLPPAPPSGFDARLINEAGGLVTEFMTDVRAPAPSSVYGLSVRGRSDGDAITISWDDVTALSAGALTLSIAGVTADLSRQGSLSFDAPSGAVTTGQIELAFGVGVEDGAGVPLQLTLAGVWPNPTGNRISIQYSLPERASVTLSIYDLLGRRTMLLPEGIEQPGWHTAQFDLSALPSGSYLLELRAMGKREVRAVQITR
jgi:hypothetical protein